MNEKLKSVLALDSIVGYLHFYERMKVHRFINQKKEDKSDLPLRVKQALCIIEKHNWERLEWDFKDRIRHYYDEDKKQFKRVTEYQHPILTEIEKL